MKKRIVQCLLIVIFISCLYSLAIPQMVEEPHNQTIAGAFNQQKNIQVSIEKANTSIVGQDQSTKEEIEELEILSEPLIFPDSYYDPKTEEYREEEFWDDCELIALVCVAEAEGESELGKRLVIDTILNRLDSEYFPNTIHEIIYAPGQYECINNGRINRVEYDEYIAKLVLEEFNNRTNNEVIYFKTKGYFNFGTPLLNEGSHYFSKR